VAALLLQRPERRRLCRKTQKRAKNFNAVSVDFPHKNFNEISGVQKK
jgi:hypothetical protein